MRGLLVLLTLLSVTVIDSAGQIAVTDRFGRNLQSRAVRLLDWEGYIANPAVALNITIPEAWRPATVEIAGSDERLHFADRQLSRSEPNTMDASGPKLTIQIQSGQEPDPVYLAIWPDRDDRDEAHSIWIGVHTASDGLKSMVLPVIVDDQDWDRPLDFHITLETGFDATNFYTNPTVLSETQKAADDWAYFLSDNDVDEVLRGSSRSWVWNPDGFLSGYWVTNPQPYRGFLLYVWGMRNIGLFSGGAASGQYQTRGGWPIDLMSAGHVAMEIRGNRNLLGWAFYRDERDWWKNDNHPRGMADFYSIVHHEIGHALFFSAGHSKWATMKATGGSTAVEVIDYLGGPAIIDRYDHIYDGGNQKYIIDPASRRGAFGSEYASGAGIMPSRRWLPTKTDILMAKEVGYELRDTSPFRELAIPDEVVLESRGPAYGADLVSGGVPDYFVEIVDGDLPSGLRLDGFSGAISGTPSSGSASVTVRATDQIGAVVEQEVHINVATALVRDPVAETPTLSTLGNYPNPFSGSTVLSFSLSQPGHASLDVFDLQGRLVDRVASGGFAAGSHEAVWMGDGLPAGIYLARLASPDGVQTHRLALVH